MEQAWQLKRNHKTKDKTELTAKRHTDCGLSSTSYVVYLLR